MSALPTEGQIIGATYYSIYEPFIVFEGKRLPAPSRDRECEYVTSGESLLGGIQRFKLALHGANHHVVAMIGYIQADEPHQWLGRVNNWIQELIEFEVRTGQVSVLPLFEVEPETGEVWQSGEEIVDFDEDTDKKVARGMSTHPRVRGAVSGQVIIKHLWIRMKGGSNCT